MIALRNQLITSMRLALIQTQSTLFQMLSQISNLTLYRRKEGQKEELNILVLSVQKVCDNER